MAGTSSLERALVLLKVIEQSPGGMTNAEIARKMSIPKTTCSYIARRLDREGYLTKDATSGRYKIGLAVVTLAHGALREVGIRTVAEPALYRLTNQTGLAGGIGVLAQGHVLLVDRVEEPQFANRALAVAAQPSASRRAPAYRGRADRDIGRELPVHSTALGKVLLAFQPRQRVLELIDGKELARSTPKTVTSKTRLLVELDQVRKQGYAIVDGEAYSELCSLAVPILGSDDTVQAALSVNGNPSEPVWLDLPGLLSIVQHAARDISRRAMILR
jgi:DNA-binding IclR family transcriptional regulator